jgi:hypothetical protein
VTSYQVRIERSVGALLRRRPRRVVVRDGVRLRAAAEVRGHGDARRLRTCWRAALAASCPPGALPIPPDLRATPRPDLVDPEGFGEVLPDEIAG